jgi:hypothetical protein
MNVSDSSALGALYLSHMKFGIVRPLIAAGFLIVCAIAFTVYASQLSGDSTSSPGSTDYRNSTFGFSLILPADLTVTESNQSGGQQTIEFLPRSGAGKQFVLLTMPYSQVDVAADTYAPHAAYGTADQGLWLRDVNVVADESTVQMWFVYSGVMYEVIGMKGDEAWLANILKTWQLD